MMTCWKLTTVSPLPSVARMISATNGSIIATATMKKPLKILQLLPDTKRQVSLTSDRTLRSRMRGKLSCPVLDWRRDEQTYHPPYRYYAVINAYNNLTYYIR